MERKWTMSIIRDDTKGDDREITINKHRKRSNDDNLLSKQTPEITPSTTDENVVLNGWL